MKRAFATVVAVICVTVVMAVQAQRPEPPRPLILNYMPQVADLGRALHFYHELLGLQAVAHVGDPRARMQWYDTRPFLVDMYGHAGQIRNFILQVPEGRPGIHVEPIQWSQAKGKALNPGLQDPGASRLVLTVSALDMLVDRLKKAGAKVVTTGGQPLAVSDATGTGRAIVFEDGNGFFVELIQYDKLPAQEPGASPRPYIYDGDITVTVADLDKSARFLHDVLGLNATVDPSFHADPKRLELYGMRGAEYREAIVAWPEGTSQLNLIQFTGISRKTLTPGVPDPNAMLVRLSVREMEGTLAKVKAFPEAQIMNLSGGPTDTSLRPNDSTPWLVVKLPGASTYLQLVGPTVARTPR